MDVNLRRRVERMERMLGARDAGPVIDQVVAILQAARRRSGTDPEGQSIQRPPRPTPEELRQRARELRRRLDAQLRIEAAFHTKRRF